MQTSYCLPSTDLPHRPKTLGEAWCNARPESAPTQGLGNDDAFGPRSRRDVLLSYSSDESNMGIANVLTLQGVPAAPPNIERNQKAASLGSASSPTRSDGHSREYLNGSDAPEQPASARTQVDLDTHTPPASPATRDARTTVTTRHTKKIARELHITSSKRPPPSPWASFHASIMLVIQIAGARIDVGKSTKICRNSDESPFLDFERTQRSHRRHLESHQF